MVREKKSVTEMSESHGQIAAIRRDLAESVALRGLPLAGTTLLPWTYPRVAWVKPAGFSVIPGRVLWVTDSLV